MKTARLPLRRQSDVEFSTLAWESSSVYKVYVCVQLLPSCLTLCNLLCPQDCPGKNTGVGCHALLQEIFPTQESNCIACASPALQADSFFTAEIDSSLDSKFTSFMALGKTLNPSTHQFSHL